MNAKKDAGTFKLNSVDEELQQGECSVFTNFTPGYPAKSRFGIKDLYQVTSNLNVFNYDMLYIPPSLAVKAPNGEIHIFVMTIKKDDDRDFFALECWNADTNFRYIVFQGNYNENVRFSFVKIHNSIYVISNYQMLNNYTTYDGEDNGDDQCALCNSDSLEDVDVSWDVVEYMLDQKGVSLFPVPQVYLDNEKDFEDLTVEELQRELVKKALKK